MSSVPEGAWDRALEFQRHTIAMVAEECRPIEEGWLIRTPSLPMVWSANEVRVSRPIRFSDALALVERHLADLPYRQLVVEHEPSARRLEHEFRAQGWKVEREVTMVLVRPPDRDVDIGDARDVDDEAALTLMARWAAEDPDLNLSREDLRQVVEHSRQSWKVRRARCLGVIGDDGGLAAITTLYSDGTIAQVEDVYTVPEERRRGFGRALVTRAASLARQGGHELTFIVADDNDSPKELYSKVGFEPAGYSWLFHREVGR
jgi:GNAT superfamily N-acetyltransferase